MTASDQRPPQAHFVDLTSAAAREAAGDLLKAVQTVKRPKDSRPLQQYVLLGCFVLPLKNHP